MLCTADLAPVQVTDVDTRCAVLSLYADDEARGAALHEQVTALLAGSDGLGTDGYEISAPEYVPPVDWAESWKENFPPIHVTDRVLVVPPWIEPSEDVECTIILDPGMSFGTGHHPTTHMCLTILDRLARERPGLSLLDCGAGSGILSIAAAKLGYREILALDHDAHAVDCARENAQTNGVCERITAECVDLLEAEQLPARDLCMANILAKPLEAMAPLIAGSMPAAGLLVLSGLLDDQFAAVTGAYCSHGLMVLERMQLDGWSSGILQKAAAGTTAASSDDTGG